MWGIWAGTDLFTKYFPVSATQAASLRVILIALLLEVILLWRPQGLLPPWKRKKADSN